MRSGKSEQVLLLGLAVLCFGSYAAVGPAFGAEEGGQENQAQVHSQGLVQPTAESGEPFGFAGAHEWSYGLYDSLRRVSEEWEETEKPAKPVHVDFRGPIPVKGTWSSASFSGYEGARPMGSFLLACSEDSSGRVSCVVVDKPTTDIPGAILYSAWSMWGDGSTGEAFVSVIPLSDMGAAASSDGPANALMACCELSNNAEGCVACTGFPSTAYDPLDSAGQQPAAETRPTPKQAGPPKRKPPGDNVKPIHPKELFALLPNLRQQLGEDADPEKLPCAGPERHPTDLPTLGDVLRSRKDLTAFGTMVATSHIQELVPCPLTFLAVTDEKIRDFQGRRPPSCLLSALARPENQREILQLVGRNALLNQLNSMPIDTSLPVLFGKPGRATRRGRDTLWNAVQITGEKLNYDRGIIHLLARNDVQDSEAMELLRRIVYWSCLHDHLIQNPGLTRFAFVMVDNNRPLPILGAPPGPRPAWVAKGNPGWIPPPSSLDSETETEKRRRRAERETETEADEQGEQGAADKAKEKAGDKAVGRQPDTDDKAEKEADERKETEQPAEKERQPKEEADEETVDQRCSQEEADKNTDKGEEPNKGTDKDAEMEKEAPTEEAVEKESETEKDGPKDAKEEAGKETERGS